jgi:hypothetical protein
MCIFHSHSHSLSFSFYFTSVGLCAAGRRTSVETLILADVENRGLLAYCPRYSRLATFIFLFANERVFRQPRDSARYAAMCIRRDKVHRTFVSVPPRVARPTPLSLFIFDRRSFKPLSINRKLFKSGHTRSFGLEGLLDRS